GIALWARIFPGRAIARRAGYTPSISVVIAAYNEGPRLATRIQNIREQDYPADQIEIIVASDGSTDGTAEVLQAEAQRDPRVKPILLTENAGKAAALNAGLAAATGEIIVFADARQRFAPDAIARLAENFADPSIGSVSGELILLQPESQGRAGVAA